MRILILTLILFLISAPYAVDLPKDASSQWRILKTTIEDASSSIKGKSHLNSTLRLFANTGTANLLYNITHTINSSWGIAASDKPAFINGSSLPMDNKYNDYLKPVPDLVSALVALGSTWHLELNYPVYWGIEELARQVQGYGSALTRAGIISENATIRTIKMGSELVRAEKAWSKPGNLPGRLVPLRPFRNLRPPS
ncbi:uncharacterized protein K452DRAFT_293717 [Aplosporella prunicola CBS 121167]|uniref:Uncharacterized protein n=1 Tax=Aplosporella prunicola CBS 121167 TaxID=1176127 RepID=A0A6A6BTE5_9PEZI|nr:uncharacterized protein K452DRAFT_293717 [Aplosporella prunicola CBS 121167]KAF2147260.1 hypothetical protein K452DRAFT_293717 [Aplosporella prunicola CBS 121167]